MAGLFKGPIETDETDVGLRKPRFKRTNKRECGATKKPIMVLVEHDGHARSMPIEKVDSAALKDEIRKHVDRSQKQ